MRKGIVRACMLGIASIGFCGWLYADIIKLKDGSWMVGKVIAETDDIIMIQAEEGVKKVYRKDIQGITKGDHQGIEGETTRTRFRINDIGAIPISDLESDVDIWIQKLEPLHRSRAGKLANAQKAARLAKMGTVYVWLSDWCKKGFLSIGMDDLDRAITILQQCETKLREDIDLLNKRSFCRGCHGSGFKDCGKCGGRGSVERYKKTTITNFKNSYTKMKKITSKCASCKGRGKVPCAYDGSRWRLCHEHEKRMKKIRGLERMVEIEAAE